MSHGDATRVLAIRHGETDWNVDGRIQGQLDIPLNDTGRWQASRLAGAVADERFAAIYASDLRRAWDTAQAVARQTGETADRVIAPDPAWRIPVLEGV